MRRCFAGHWTNPQRRIHSQRFMNKKTHPVGCLFIHEWLGMRDSNPRMVGPEPTALPLGESPTDYSVLVIVIQIVKKCKAPDVSPEAFRDD